mgnify:CR=1 FL=1
MKRFTAVLNDGGYVNLPATRMQLEDNAIRVYDGTELVAFLDVSVILCAHISERKESNA